MSHDYWDDEKVAKLQSLWGTGLSAELVARALGGGISRCAVIGKVHRLKLTMRGWTRQGGKERMTPQKANTIKHRDGLAVKPGGRPKGTPNAPTLTGDGQRLPRSPLPTPDPMPAVLVPFEALERDGCRFLHGNVGEVWGYCPEKAVLGKSWCSKHLSVVYRTFDAFPTRSPQIDRIAEEIRFVKKVLAE